MKVYLKYKSENILYVWKMREKKKKRKKVAIF